MSLKIRSSVHREGEEERGVIWRRAQAIHEEYREKKPVMLFDMQAHRMYVYPYLAFQDDLSESSQRHLQDQYAQVMTDDKIVVFVRDQRM